MKKIFITLCLLLPLMLQAAQEKDLYQVEVQVADQSTGERIKGMSAAIKEVFVRVSGSKLIVDDSELAAAIVSPGRYVEGYRYEQRQKGTETLNFLLFSFSAKALESLLVKKKLPIWPAPRPDVLVWLAVEKRSRPYVVKDEPLNIINQAVIRAAISRGLPLSWPLNTDIDAGKVRAPDIRAGFVKQIAEASKDYSIDNILIGHVKHHSSGHWSGEWKLVRKGQTESWEGDSLDLQGVVSAGIDAVADTLAAESSISAGDEQDLLLVKVNNVSDLEGYAGTRSYLGELLITQNIAVVKVHDNAVEYQLRLRGKAEEFLRAINLGGEMRVVPQVVTADHIDPQSREGASDLSQPDYTLELTP